jgi:hypothetical protein
METDGIPIAVEDEHADMRVLGKISEIGEHAVAPVFRIEQMLIPKDVNETGFSELGGAIAFASAVALFLIETWQKNFPTKILHSH